MLKKMLRGYEQSSLDMNYYYTYMAHSTSVYAGGFAGFKRNDTCM